MKKIDTLQVLTPTPSEAANNELIIADGGAADIRELLHGSPLPTLLLHGASEPLLAITNALQDSPRDTLHLVAHGRSDGFMLGGYWIDANCLRESASLLAQWRLDSIALWICQAGANRELVELFARLTGAEVHATPDFLGWVNNIASWQLPLVQTGSTSLSLPSAENNFHFPFQAERAQSWRSQLAGLTFDNAYAVNTATSPAGKEQNSIDFGSTALGSVTITDGTNGLKFSGNDVVVKLTINGIDHYGWISRPIKSGGKIKGFYFWEDSSFTDLTTATADGNSDADGDANNIGFVLVVDQAFFDGLNVSGGLKSVGSSSDRVDSSLNKVLPVNSPPAAVNDSAIFLEDSIAQTGNILSNDTDTNGNTLTVSSFSIDGSPGTLGSAFTIAGVGSFTLSSTGAYSFTAVAHYSGAVPAITYIVSDGTLTSTGNLAIALTEVNDAPSGADKTITSQENQSYTFSAADFGFSDTTDTPANALQSVVITTLPGAGTLKLNGSDVIAGNEVSLSDISKLIFTPASNEIGTGYASFTFQVRDNGGTSNSGINLDASANTLTFNISNLNSAPTAVADIETAVEAGGASNATTGTNPTGNVLTNDTDPDSGDTKTVLSAKSAAASDTTVATDTSITGVYGTLVISTDGSYTYTVNNSNVEVEALRVNANTLTDTFNYTMEDTAGLKSSSTLTVTVQGANDNPNGVNDNAIAKESIVGSGNYDVSDVTGYQATGNVLNNDTDVDSAANGETSKTVAGLSGTATANVVGSANVSSKIVFTAASTLNPVSGGDYLYIVIGGIERALYNAGGDHITVVSKTEVSTDNYEFVLSSTPAAYYDVDATDTKIAYTIASGAVIAFNANTVNADPNGATKTATVSSSSETGNSTSTLTSISGAPAAGMTVTGTGVPAGTTIESIAYDGSNNPTLTFSSIVTTTTGQAFTFSADAGATLTGRYGSLVLNSDGSYTYTPTANNAVLSEGGSGTESFTYRVKDTLNTEDTAVLTIKVLGSGSNDPDANADTVTAVEAGTAAGTNPTDNVITNDTTPSGTGTLSVNNAAKSGAAETAVTAATDITGLYGTLNIDTDGAYTYTVDNSNGTVNALRTSSNTLTDTFNYKVINSSSKVSEGTLTVTVQGANDAPVAVADTSSAYEAGGVGNGTTGSNPSGNLLSNDTDVDTGDGKSVTAFSTSGSSAGTLGAALTGTYGSLTVSSNGSYTYTVDNSNSTVQALGLGQTVSESFNYTDADTAGATSSSTLTVTVNGANDAPVNTVPGTNPSVSEAGTVSISGVSVADVDSASLTVTLTVLNGTVSVTAGTSTVTNSGTATVTITGTLAAINTALDTLSYTGASDFNGTDTLKIVASDGSLTDTDTLDITVTADNRSLSVSGTTVNEASPYAMFQVTGVASQKVSLTLGSTASTGDTDASSSTDFLPNMQYYNGSAWTTYSGGLVSIPSGGSTMLVRVPVLNDNSDELDETFTLTASNKAGTGSTPAISTIVDDGNGSVFLGSNNSFSANGISDAGYPATLDDDRALTVNNISVNENSTYAVFQVGGAAGQVITLAQAAGSATADTDYGSTLEVWNGTTSTWGNYGSSATIPAGGVLLVRSTVTDDATYEGAETFGLRATNGGGVGYTGTATILDDGTGLIYDGTVTGNTATTTSSGLDNDLSISVSASTPVSENSTYAMFSVTATAGSALTLAVAGSGTTQATTSSFVIEFSTDAGGTWTTYSASSTPLVAGTLGSGTGTVAVRVQISSEQDTTFEGAETFSLTATMAAGGNTPLSGAAEATIIDNGTGASYDGTLSGGTPVSSSTGLDDDTPTLSVSSVTVSEASAFANFTVSLSNASTTAISFTPSLSSGTATVGSDTGNTPSTAAIEYYDGSSWVSAVSGVSIGANNTSVVLRTAITNDSVLETSESFTLTTGTITGTVTNSGAASGTATIKDDGSSTNVFLVDNFTGVPTTGAADNDTAGAGLTITGSSLTTSETGTDASFTVKLNSQPSADVTVTLTGLDGTEGSLSTSTLTFTSANWNTAQTITISGLDDTLDDGDISYTLTATSSSSDANYDGANARTGTVGVTNTDTDVAPSLSIDDVSASESAGTFLFTVTRSGATGGTTTVDYATANGTALAGSDYTAQSGSLSFAPGETSKTISVSINDDSVIEGSEAFTVGLTNIDDASSSAESISDNSGGGTIIDKDKRVEPPVITDVTEITTDPTPFDLLTNDVTQLIQVQGAAGHTLRLYTADNVLIPTSNYTVTEKSSGSYEIDARGINLLAGDYVVRQIDANDNESQNSNAFTIDSTPEVQDNINARVPLPEGGMNGSLSVIDQNRLDLTDLQSTSPPVNWFDSDGENVVFGIAGVQVVNNISTSVLASGSTLTLNAVDGSYVYKPSANAVIDIFTTTVRDPGGKGGNLNLTFEVRDLLDRDGISGNTEDELAKLVTGGQKDRNKDGLDDSVQNSVTTLAWVRQENFAEAVAGNFANVPNSSVITIIAHKSTEGEEASAIAQLIGIEVLNLDVSGNGIISTNGLDGISTPWDPIKFSVEPLQSLGLIDIDNERDGLQVRLSINISEAAVPEDGFSGYMKYISADVIIAAQQAGVLLTTFDGETLSETSQAGWYDFMQRTPGGDGARFIVQDGIIVSIELILTDNAFGDVDFTIGRLTDPGMPVAQEEAMPALITGPSGGKGAVASQKFISENSTVVTQFIANEAVAWTLADSQDDSLFELYADGTLVFKAAPDYEAAQDSDLDNNYELLVQAIDFSGNVSEQQVTVTVTDVLEAAPIYAAEIGNNDHYLSGLASDAQAQQLSATNPLRIEFYVFPTQQDDTLPLKAWVNTITGDFFYAPEGTPPPYACYIAFDAIGLGYVYEAGQGDFDVHLFMNEEGITQIMGIETASELGLASAGYTDIGVLFASSEAPYTVVELTGVSDLPINDFLI